ncbi:MAG: hypothetical protein QNK05_17545 [Myxococcota bacterium]|nr:hypothetical protein [Myxococcota bacterium]
MTTPADARPLSFEFASDLPGASPEAVWAHAASWDGVNHELAPWIRMTFPAQFTQIEDIPADGTSHFTSALLLFGAIPIDFHRFVLRELEPGRRFDELSSNGLLRSWAHERVIEAIPGGTRVIDRCALEPRFRWLGRLLLAIYRELFRRRHRRLSKLFAR